MRRANNPNYLTFTAAETVCTPKQDRGSLRTNDMGDFFMREFMVDGVEKFSCCSPELERALIDAGCRAGFPVGITRVQQKGRSIIWHARRIGDVAEMPNRQHRTFLHNGAARTAPLPESKYAAPPTEPPDGYWESLSSSLSPKDTPTTAKTTPVPAEPIASALADSLIARALCEAIDAAKVGQQHAAAIGFPLTFSSSDIQDLASTIFIQRCKDGAIIERRPAGRVDYSVNNHVNGAI